MGKAHEQGLFEQFVAHAAVEALDLAVHHRFVRSGLVLLPGTLAAPYEHGVAGDLGTFIADDQVKLASLGDQLGQLTHHTLPRDRSVGHRCQALYDHVIDHVEHP